MGVAVSLRTAHSCKIISPSIELHRNGGKNENDYTQLKTGKKFVLTVLF